MPVKQRRNQQREKHATISTSLIESNESTADRSSVNHEIAASPEGSAPVCFAPNE